MNYPTLKTQRKQNYCYPWQHSSHTARVWLDSRFMLHVLAQLLQKNKMQMMKELEETHLTAMKELEATFDKRLELETHKYALLKAQKDDMQFKHEESIIRLNIAHQGNITATCTEWNATLLILSCIRGTRLFLPTLTCSTHNFFHYPNKCTLSERHENYPHHEYHSIWKYACCHPKKHYSDCCSNSLLDC